MSKIPRHKSQMSEWSRFYPSLHSLTRTTRGFIICLFVPKWWNGRHARLRGVWGNPCGFKSRLRHQTLPIFNRLRHQDCTNRKCVAGFERVVLKGVFSLHGVTGARSEGTRVAWPPSGSRSQASAPATSSPAFGTKPYRLSIVSVIRRALTGHVWHQSSHPPLVVASSKIHK